MPVAALTLGLESPRPRESSQCRRGSLEMKTLVVALGGLVKAGLVHLCRWPLPPPSAQVCLAITLQGCTLVHQDVGGHTEYLLVRSLSEAPPSFAPTYEG